MEIIELLENDAIILVPALLVIGKILKDFENIQNKWIPIILLPVGVLGCLIICGLNVESVIQGVLVTGTAVYGNQVVKQLKKKE